MRIALFEGRRLCRAPILEREEECGEDRVAVLPVDRVELSGLFDAAFPDADVLDFADLDDEPEFESED